jgi:magnesium transporter
MLNIWKQKTQLEEIKSFERNCWINVSNPTPEEISRLIEDFRVPEEFINDIIDVDERSRIEVEGRWLMIIVRIPVYRTDNGIPFITVPLGILISAHSIITICLYENEIIKDILYPIKNKTISLDNKANFVLELFLRSANQFLKNLKEINIRTSHIEKDIEKATKNKELQNLLRMEKCLVYFITSLKSNEVLLQKLQRSRFARLDEFDEDLLADAIIETRQAIEMSQIYSDIQSGLMDTFASVISNNLNMVMKQLTSITIILMVPTLISSFYGMNLNNHMENAKYGFFVVVGISLALAIGLVMIFRRRNWF